MPYADIDFITSGDDGEQLARDLVQHNENVKSLRDGTADVVPELENDEVAVGSPRNRIVPLQLTEGELLVGSTAGIVALPPGRGGQILTITGRQPGWQSAPTVRVLRSDVLRYA